MYKEIGEYGVEFKSALCNLGSIDGLHRPPDYGIVPQSTLDQSLVLGESYIIAR
jgi:hypothetical protein